MKTISITIYPAFAACVLAFFAILPQLQAVSPAPDGCYPNYTTAEGCNALAGLGAGVGNTGIGWYSLFSAGNSSFSTGVGGGALALNTGDANTAVGAAALLLNTSGINNTATGTDALVHNDSGSKNTANGVFALFNNVGADDNTATGYKALFSNASGAGNTAVGFLALNSNTGGSANTAIGNQALNNNTTGSQNVAIGFGAGGALVTGDFNIYIGSGTPGLPGESAACYIGNIFNSTSASGIPVLVNSANKLGTTTSSKRFKTDIKPMENASDVLYSLEPVAFHYKKEIDPAQTPQLGLVAEDVEKVNPDLIIRDKEGKPYSVRYDQVNAMLLNEFLKEHHKVQLLEKAMAEQQTENAATRAMLKEQAAQIQKVSAQLELNKSAPQTVLNNH